jgi:hypothetical protein
MDTVDQLTEDVVARAQSDDPLQRLSAAVLTAEDVRDRADELLDRFVTAARAAGRSWTEIGAVLGVTKQAAQQRFVAVPGAKDFAAGARALLPVADRHARGFRHRYVGTEHLLLALLDDPGLAGAALARAGVTAEPVRRRIREIAGEGHADEAGLLGVTPRTKRVLEASGREARRLGHRCAAPEHVLLALGGEHGGLAVRILRELDVTDERLRAELAGLLAGEAPELAARIARRSRRRLRR